MPVCVDDFLKLIENIGLLLSLLRSGLVQSGYRIIKQRLRLFHGTERFIGMDFVDPPIEFAALAQALGVRSHRIETPDAFRAAYIDAVAAREPAFIEIMVDGSV
jgi:benzoylformate decarboxylase